MQLPRPSLQVNRQQNGQQVGEQRSAWLLRVARPDGEPTDTDSRRLSLVKRHKQVEDEDQMEYLQLVGKK